MQNEEIEILKEKVKQAETDISINKAAIHKLFYEQKKLYKLKKQTLQQIEKLTEVN